MDNPTGSPQTIDFAPGLPLPLQAVTETFAWIARRGMGKTYNSKRFMERLMEAGQQVIAADPLGVWYGVRLLEDGETPSPFQVLIFGGDHADVAITPDMGAAVALFLVDSGHSAVLDLSRFRPGEQIQFMVGFCEELFHANRAPLHLILDEADIFAPQGSSSGSKDKSDDSVSRCLGAVEALVRRGRVRGVGLSLITQRPAVLNKNVLSMCECLVCFRVSYTNDRKAISEWVKVHGTPEELDEMSRTLASLPVGSAWFWSPGWLEVFQRIAFDKALTFDSSATPKPGEVVRSARPLEKLDLSGLAAKFENAVQTAKDEDPAYLREQIKELEAKLSERPPEGISRQSVLELIGAFSATLALSRRELRIVVDREAATLGLAVSRFEVKPDELPQWVYDKSGERVANEVPTFAVDVASYESPPCGFSPSPAGAVVVAVDTAGPKEDASVVVAREGGTIIDTQQINPEEADLDGPRLRLLMAVRRLEVSRLPATREMIALVCKVRATGGTFRDNLNKLVKDGHLAKDGDAYRSVRDFPQAPPVTMAEYRANLCDALDKLGSGLSRMYRLLIQRRLPISIRELAAALAVKETGGTFRDNVNKLARWNVIRKDKLNRIHPGPLFAPEHLK